MSNWVPAIIGIGCITFTAGLVMLYQRVHMQGWQGGANQVVEDIRMYMLKEVGDASPEAVAALMQAVAIAGYHRNNYRAIVSGLPRLPSLTSPGEGRHRK